MSKVLQGFLKKIGIIRKHSDSRIALAAQQATDSVRTMAMVNGKLYQQTFAEHDFWFATNRT